MGSSGLRIRGPGEGAESGEDFGDAGPRCGAEAGGNLLGLEEVRRAGRP